MDRVRAALEAMRRRPTLAAALVYAGLSIAFLGPALLPGKTLSNADTLWFQAPWVGVKPAELQQPSNTELGDAPGQLQPFLRYTSERMPEIPLWNPYIVGGRPFLANAQSAVFSPYTLPAYVLPFDTALGWIGVLKLWVAAFGMFLLASRAFRMGFGASLFAGIVYGFSLWMVTWLSYPHMSVWSFMPWMLLLAAELVRRPDLLAGAGLAAVLALQFLCGHPESSFHALLATSAFLVLRLIQARREGAEERRAARTLLVFAGALAGGLALAAVTIIPFTELLAGSADLRDRQGYSVDKQPVLGEFALGIFLPDYWGRPTATPIRPFVLDRAFYIGALPLMLAVAAVVIRPNLERLAVAAFGMLWLAVLFGVPPFLEIVTRLPVFSSGHNSRVTALFVLSAAILAGLGLDDLVRGRWRQRKRAVLVAAAVVLVLPIAYDVVERRTAYSVIADAVRVAAGATPPGAVVDPVTGGRSCLAPCAEPGNIVRLASMVSWVTLAAAALLLIGLRFRERLRPTPFVALALVLVCVDLFHAGMGYNPAIERKWASQPPTGAIRALESRVPARYVAMDGLPQNVISMRHGLYEARGYDLPIMRRFDRLWRRQVSPESESVSKGLLDTPLTLREITPSGLRVLRLLGVTSIAQRPDVPRLDVRGLRLVYEGRDARVYSLSGALPRAFVVPAQRVVDGEDEAYDAITAPDFDARAAAVTEEEVGDLPQRPANARRPTGGTGSARLTTYEPERVVTRVRANRAGMLVLSDNYYPGWKATVDGRDADIERVNYTLRGVRVEPGVHTVEFRYEPLTWRIGWIVSLLSLIGLVVALVVGRRRRRAADASAPPLAPDDDDGRLAPAVHGPGPDVSAR